MGHILKNNQIKPDDDRIEAIRSMKSSTNTLELRAFLGAVNFGERFMPNLQSKCVSLYRLAVEAIKNALSDTQILVPYDGKSSLRLMCDACEKSLGAVLLQEEKLGQFRRLFMAQGLFDQRSKDMLRLNERR